MVAAVDVSYQHHQESCPFNLKVKLIHCCSDLILVIQFCEDSVSGPFLKWQHVHLSLG